MTTGIKIGGRSINNGIYADYNTSFTEQFFKRFQRAHFRNKNGMYKPH